VTEQSPERYQETAIGLAEDHNPRVRRVLAEAAARAYPEKRKDLTELLEILTSDVRHSVRSAARSLARANQTSNGAQNQQAEASL